MSPTPTPRVSLSAACLLSFALLTACDSSVSADQKEPTGQTESSETSDDPNAVQKRELPKVRVTEVRTDDMQRFLETTAAVESVSEIDVVAEANGRVLQVLVEEGERVSAGQILARLDARDQSTALADARLAVIEAETAIERGAISEREAAARTFAAAIALEHAQREFKRHEDLTAGETANPVSDQAVEASRLARDNAAEALKQLKLAEVHSAVDSKVLAAALDRAKLAAQRAERDLERTQITAPINGVIAKRSVEIGRNLNLGEVAFQMTDPDHLRVVFFRPQRELDLFTSGASLDMTASCEARLGFTFEGSITRTSPTIDRQSGAFRVTAHLEPESRPNEAGQTARLFPGMLMRLMVVTGTHADALVVPKRALRRESSNVFVLAVENDVLRRILVREGYATDDDIEITPISGALDSGASVVLIGSRDLEDGDGIQVDDAPDA